MLRRTDQSLDTLRTSSTKPSCANRRMQRRGAYGFAMEAEEKIAADVAALSSME
ncbi:unnamed protein product [Brassica rapa]|uniref:Uncharacterized protein n=1 Tax=Brassica campestris TaxID=3711 RepID=A0A8D9MF09_BRACM|nr:unnamed protein product [Brassica rapa]